MYTGTLFRMLSITPLTTFHLINSESWPLPEELWDIKCFSLCMIRRGDRRHVTHNSEQFAGKGEALSAHTSGAALQRRGCCPH